MYSETDAIILAQLSIYLFINEEIKLDYLSSIIGSTVINSNYVSNINTNTDVLLLETEQNYYIIIISSKQIKNWMNTYYFLRFNLNKNKLFGNSQIQQGFYYQFMSVENDILTFIQNHNKFIYYTGYSIGGAIAVLCSYFINSCNKIVYSYNSPTVGNKYFTNSYINNVEHYNFVKGVDSINNKIIKQYKELGI